MQRPAKPCTPVRFRPWPPKRSATKSKVVHEARLKAGFLSISTPTKSDSVRLNPGEQEGTIGGTWVICWGNQMASKTLTAVAASKAKPREKNYKLAAGGGLYLEVMPSGAKYWRWKY